MYVRRFTYVYVDVQYVTRSTLSPGVSITKRGVHSYSLDMLHAMLMSYTSNMNIQGSSQHGRDTGPVQDKVEIEAVGWKN